MTKFTNKHCTYYILSTHIYTYISHKHIYMCVGTHIQVHTISKWKKNSQKWYSIPSTGFTPVDQEVNYLPWTNMEPVEKTNHYHMQTGLILPLTPPITKLYTYIYNLIHSWKLLYNNVNILSQIDKCLSIFNRKERFELQTIGFLVVVRF